MVSLLAIAEFESGKRFPHPQMRWDLHDAFRAAGIEFIEDAPGVRMAAAPGGPA
jgi:hypothetical protein